VAVITHGQAKEAETRESVNARGYLHIARDFARRGWLAVVVVRRGFGKSIGPTPYALRRCQNGDYAPLLTDQADDLEAAIAALARRADADTSTVMALGVSVGGAAVLELAARQPSGLKAVVNISGGVKIIAGPSGKPPQCTAEDLIPVFARLGERTRLPALWLYAENDSYFPAGYVRQLHEAYVAKGGRTRFHMFEAIGKDGHDLINLHDGMLRWIPALDDFLRANGLKTYDQAPINATINALQLPAGSRQVFRRYHGRPTEKALAVSQSNRTAYASFAGADLPVIEKAALENCARLAREPCRIVLRNFEIVTPAQ